ncbi:MAG: 30S ribosomal protein S17 [Candidatus Omnitrophota bacterium]
MAEQQDARKKFRKEFVGTVVSDKMNKTRVVVVPRLTRHGMYGKTIKLKEKYKIHDEKNESHVGDRVRLCETRPLSKDKRWRLVEIIAKAKSTVIPNDL